MFLRKYRQNRIIMMRVGMLCLIAGALSTRFMTRIPGVSSNLADGTTGLFYGLAIGFLLMSLRGRPCA